MSTISSTLSKANGILMESNGITNGRMGLVGIWLGYNRNESTTSITRDASTKQWCEY